jgi:hypothetical protein
MSSLLHPGYARINYEFAEPNASITVGTNLLLHRVGSQSQTFQTVSADDFHFTRFCHDDNVGHRAVVAGNINYS